MNTYQYKEIDITFNPSNANFTATVDGKMTVAGSLDGMKRKIDAALKNAFQPFDALEFPNHYTPIAQVVPVTVTGISKPAKGRRARWDSTAFQYSKPGGWGATAVVLVPNTPEARQAIEDFLGAADKRRQALEKLDRAVDDAKAKIPTIHVNDYVK